MIQKFRRIQTSDTDLTLVQDNVANTLNPLTRVALLDGQLLTNVALSTVPLRIEHLLGRKPLGYIVTGLNQAATIFGTESDARLMTLTASNNGTICSLWVF